MRKKICCRATAIRFVLHMPIIWATTPARYLRKSKISRACPRCEAMTATQPGLIESFFSAILTAKQFGEARLPRDIAIPESDLNRAQAAE